MHLIGESPLLNMELIKSSAEGRPDIIEITDRLTLSPRLLLNPYEEPVLKAYKSMVSNLTEKLYNRDGNYESGLRNSGDAAGDASPGFDLGSLTIDIPELPPAKKLVNSKGKDMQSVCELRPFVYPFLFQGLRSVHCSMASSHQFQSKGR